MVRTSLWVCSFVSILLLACGPEKTKVIVPASGDKVLDELNTLIEKAPQDHALLYQRAEYQYKNENYDGSIEDLQKAIDLDSSKVTYYHLLSDVYMDYFRSKDALQTLEKCVIFNPKSQLSMLKLSETQFILKRYDESLMTVNKILSINDQNAEAFFMMGMNLRALDNKEKAISAFQMATEIDPELLDAWLILGDLHQDSKNPIALDYYNAAIDLAPDNPTTYHSKAYYLQNTGKVNEAIALYKKINLVDKNYIDAYLNAGILYSTLDSTEKAFEQFDIMTKVQPQNYLGYYYRGVSNYALNKIEAAKNDFNNCLNLNPDFEKAQLALDELNSN